MKQKLNHQQLNQMENNCNLNPKVKGIFFVKTPSKYMSKKYGNDEALRKQMHKQIWKCSEANLKRQALNIQALVIVMELQTISM